MQDVVVGRGSRDEGAGAAGWADENGETGDDKQVQATRLRKKGSESNKQEDNRSGNRNRGTEVAAGMTVAMSMRAVLSGT